MILRARAGVSEVSQRNMYSRYGEVGCEDLEVPSTRPMEEEVRMSGSLRRLAL